MGVEVQEVAVSYLFSVCFTPSSQSLNLPLSLVSFVDRAWQQQGERRAGVVVGGNVRKLED